MSKQGITITRESFHKVVPAFVMWLDQTYPHLHGRLTIEEKEGKTVFAYESLDGQKLSDQDKAIIRKKWELEMERAKHPEPEDHIHPALAQVIADIEGGYIVAAAHALIEFLAQLTAEKQEETKTEVF